jgi:hypothetical protein
VWIVGLALLLFGALGAIANAATLQEGVRYGDESLVALPAIGLVVTIAQMGSGALILVGRVPWARTAALTVCGINAISVLIGLLNGTGIAGVVGLLVNFALAVGLADDDLKNWCRRDR